MLDVLNRISSLKRCHNCGWAEAETSDGTGPQLASRDGVAYWRGVQRCGSIHCCPVCGAKIRNGRAIETSAFAAEAIRRGYEVWMVSLTSPHDLGMALVLLMMLIAGAWRSLLGGRAWAGTPYVPERISEKTGRVLPAKPAQLGVRDLLGVVGTIRALEITWGKNGWHVHLHCLVFVREPLDAEGLVLFYSYFREQWRKYIASTCRECGKRKGRGKEACRCGGGTYRPPSDEHGVKIERCYSGSGAAEYICKTQEGKDPGNELARADMKTARTGHWMPFQILDAAGDGESWAVKLWHEFESGTFRKQAITWSPELRKLQREWLGQEEKDDEELAAEEVGGDAEVDFSAEVMREAKSVRGLRGRLLEAFEEGGLWAVADMVAAHGFIMAPSWDGGLPKVYLARKAVAEADRGG